MVLAIFAGMVLTAALSSWATVLVRPPKPLSRRNRRLIEEAAVLLARLRNPTDLTHVDVLSEPSRQATDRWLTRYNKEFTE